MRGTSAIAAGGAQMRREYVVMLSEQLGSLLQDAHACRRCGCR